MAAQRAMSKVGPGELTLAHIATEAGITAGLLVQRFGSKRDLLLKLSEQFSGGTSEMFAELRRGHRSPLATLRAYSDCMAHMAASPAAFARNFAYLQIDLTDPDFRRHLGKHARATRLELQKLIKEAIDAERAVAGYQCQAVGAHHRSGGERIDVELGLLPGRRRREMDAS